ncbi:MAG: hypothetical protein JO265_10435 [Acidimicrobiia bacterium]|nr:hypothetical protein [Acidimicrobiia bacterium]
MGNGVEFVRHGTQRCRVDVLGFQTGGQAQHAAAGLIERWADADLGRSGHEVNRWHVLIVRPVAPVA